MSEPTQKCKNNAIFKHQNAQKTFISFKMDHSCCFNLRGNLIF